MSTTTAPHRPLAPTTAPPGAGRTPAPSRPPASGRRPAPGPPRLMLPPVVEPLPGPTVAERARFALPVRSVLEALPDGAAPWAGASAPGGAAEREVTRRPPLPDAAEACSVVVLAAVEVLTGARSPAQLVRWVTPAVHDRLLDRLPDAVPLSGGAGTRRPGGPGSPRPERALRRARVLRTRCQAVGPDAAEAAVVVHDGRRVRAAAVRVEAHRGRWRATVLQIG